MIQNSFFPWRKRSNYRCELFLEEMEEIIPWGNFYNEVQPFYKEKETGRKRMELMTMLNY